NLFRFFIDLLDFGQSVKNLYYVSFLVCDGTCAIKCNESMETVISKCDRKTLDLELKTSSISAIFLTNSAFT
ncbi:hypothetical protein EV702DRAFT_967627, partial [Suillus placidus]